MLLSASVGRGLSLLRGPVWSGGWSLPSRVPGAVWPCARAPALPRSSAARARAPLSSRRPSLAAALCPPGLPRASVPAPPLGLGRPGSPSSLVGVRLVLFRRARGAPVALLLARGLRSPWPLAWVCPWSCSGALLVQPCCPRGVARGWLVGAGRSRRVGVGLAVRAAGGFSALASLSGFGRGLRQVLQEIARSAV